MGHVLYPSFRDLQGFDSSYSSRSKEEWWGWILRRISIVLRGNCLRKNHYNFFRQYSTNPLRTGKEDTIMVGEDNTTRGKKAISWDRETNFAVDGKAASTGNWENFSTKKEDSSECRASVSQFHYGFPTHYYFNIQHPIFGLVCSFPPKCLQLLDIPLINFFIN